MKVLIAVVLIVFLIGQTRCMQKLLPLKTSQKKITIIAADENIKVEEWKIFQSKLLSKHYFNSKDFCDKNKILPLFPSVLRAKELQLCSNALDCQPGILFKDYVDKLLPKNRTRLISLAGRYDDNGNKNRLYMPGLIAQLVDACLPSDISNYIQYYVGKKELVEHIIHNKIKYDALLLPHTIYGEGTLVQIFSTINVDYLRNSYISDESAEMTCCICDNLNWVEYCSCQIDEHKKFFITAAEPQQDKKCSLKLCNEFLLWNEDSECNVKKTICCSHKGEVTALCINAQRQLFVSSAVENDINTIKLWDCAGKLLYESAFLFDGRVVQAVFINDGDGLLINFLGKNTSLIKIYNIVRLQSINEIAIAERPGNDFFCYVIIDPDLIYRGDIIAAIVTYYDTIVSADCWTFHEDKGSRVDGKFNINILKNSLCQWRFNQHIKDGPFAWLMAQKSCFISYLLYRFYEANKRNKNAFFYQQEPAYKMLKMLPKQDDCNVKALLEKCCKMFILSNKKSVSENCGLM